MIPSGQPGRVLDQNRRRESIDPSSVFKPIDLKSCRNRGLGPSSACSPLGARKLVFFSDLSVSVLVCLSESRRGSFESLGHKVHEKTLSFVALEPHDALIS